jgi:ABC-type polysaccharide/polyol phosphate transport system ATPase subunit
VSPTTVQLDALSIHFRVPREQVSGIKEFAIRKMRRQLAYMDVWALRQVSLTIHAGEMLGVVGRNGAGKSTLLKAIARVLHPTEGRVRVYGQVVPVLDLGGGFHPELTGRENIYLYASLLGHSRAETGRRLNEIVEFAELGDFLDAPLRTYSTGMSMRLAFAVAACRPAEVLLVDEALSVGDEAFQRKCLERMRAHRDSGACIVLVSHAAEAIRKHCDRAIWLEAGRLRLDGKPAEVLAGYHASEAEALVEEHPA